MEIVAQVGVQDHTFLVLAMGNLWYIQVAIGEHCGIGYLGRKMDNRRWYLKEKISLPRWLYMTPDDWKHETILVARRCGKRYLAACLSIAYFLRSLNK